MKALVLGTNNTMELINKLIVETHDPITCITTFPQCPHVAFNGKKSMEAREKNYKRSNEGKKQWESYTSTMILKQIKKIGYLMDKKRMFTTTRH